ncbi:hypothetical protein Vadar_009946 [Vaccinium darrowii]|uniref:Uncharacterized protein n=1 Tax=Vaccinium darrowii TaxID=229202 RepID=A0ACB7XY28_9ERIC|nr:hypothetical protein Vadar_009946 [Vaccinium darrowii]
MLHAIKQLMVERTSTKQPSPMPPQEDITAREPLLSREALDAVPAQPPQVVPLKTTTSPAKASVITPFSAVAPPLFRSLCRLQIHITLETIHEEETAEEFIETSADSFSATFLSKNQSCFLEVPKPWSSSDNKSQCA